MQRVQQRSSGVGANCTHSLCRLLLLLLRRRALATLAHGYCNNTITNSILTPTGHCYSIRLPYMVTLGNHEYDHGTSKLPSWNASHEWCASWDCVGYSEDSGGDCGPSCPKNAPRSLRRALLMPQVNTGSRYRGGKGT